MSGTYCSYLPRSDTKLVANKLIVHWGTFMKEPMFRGELVAICAVLFCNVALSQAPIPEKGPIPDDRGFEPTNAERVAKVNVVVRHIAGQAYVIAIPRRRCGRHRGQLP